MRSADPSEWVATSIRELEKCGAIELGRGKIISQKDIATDPGDYPVYSSSARGNGEFGRYAKYMFDEELVTWSVDGGGKFFYRPKARYSITNVSGFLRVNEKEKLDTYYAWAHLYSLWQTMTFNYSEKLHPSVLRERFSFSYPCLDRQKEIGSILSSVERAIAAQERIIQNTTELKQALMQKLFSEGLRGGPQKETEIGLVPESWEVVELGDIAMIERGKFSHRPRNEPRFYSGEYPFVQTGDVSNCDGRIRSYTQTLNDDGLAISKMFPAGTILITIAANIGFTGILEFDSACPDSLIGITPRDNVNTEFLNYYLMTQQQEMDRLAPKGTQKNINIQFLKRWPVPLPSIEEQTRISDAFSAADQKIRLATKKRTHLCVIFRTLLHELMSSNTQATATNSILAV